jgi:membrane-bound lytic murein transglycosylase D
MVHIYSLPAHFNHFFILRDGKYVDTAPEPCPKQGMKQFSSVLFACILLLPAAAAAAPAFSYPGVIDPATESRPESAAPEGKRPRLTAIDLPLMDGRDSFACTRDHSILRRPEVRKALIAYLSDARNYTAAILAKADFHKNETQSAMALFPLVPEEVAALPLLESGYEPFAVSRMKAVGAWQIIAPTAYALGLTIDRWTDERRDVKKSTAAAIQHLSHLYQMYNHWDFALAAYNGGSPRVTKAIIKEKTRDYWTLVELNAFRKETNDYVPHFAALALIHFNRELFGFQIPDVKAPPCEKITLAYPVRIDALANIAGTDTATVMRLNPEMIGPITPPGRDHYAVKLPAGSADRILGREDELYKSKVPYITRYRVRKGDTVSKIAKMYRTDATAIIYLNGMAKPYYLHIGNEIYVPKG